MTRVKSYDRPEQMREIVGRPSKLTPEQSAYVRKAAIAREKMTNAYMARQFNVSVKTITNHIHSRCKRYQERLNGPQSQTHAG